ncbi:unnamed protein product [Rangifer tarandus platyrhynchus]|uniref:Uncharacterized protein n=2 Tax=Rangifer tarandus platyrhynchus TaxID=3082113 RepID=A0ABN8YYI3_RANTA|nr:unnamed protein product [Rangifer tarandus platyrhynchus]
MTLGGRIKEGATSAANQFSRILSAQLSQADEAHPGPSVSWSQKDPRKLVQTSSHLLPFCSLVFSLCPGRSHLLPCPPPPFPPSTPGHPPTFSAQPKSLSYTSQASGSHSPHTRWVAHLPGSPFSSCLPTCLAPSPYGCAFPAVLF